MTSSGVINSLSTRSTTPSGQTKVQAAIDLRSWHRAATAKHDEQMQSTTFLGISRGWRAALVIGFAGFGLALGWFLPALVRWLLELPWVPLEGPLRLLDKIPEPWLQLGAAGLGLLAGVWIGVAAIVEALALTVSDQQVELRINGTTRTFTRDRVGAAFLDGKRLVLLDSATLELAREKPEVSAKAVAEGFRAHGYPWSEGDPHKHKYRLWVPEMPGLPEGGNALLSARTRALEKKQADDVTELRRELGRLGVVVRDEGTRQYWRRVPVDPYR
jgi:hypothetical protein